MTELRVGVIDSMADIGAADWDACANPIAPQVKPGPPAPATNAETNLTARPRQFHQ